MNDANLEQNLPLSQWKQFGVDLRRHVDPIVIHGIATLVAIVFMSLTKQLLDYSMGHDARFFDVLPVRYVIDAIDLLMCVRFMLSVWRS